MNDIRQTKNYALYLTSLGWKIEKEKGVYYFTRRILPFLKIIKVQRPKLIDTEFLEKAASEEKITITIVEPKDKNQAQIIQDKEFKTTKPYLPSKTLILNLSLPLLRIIEKTKKDCRLAIRKTQKIKIKNCKEKDLAEFHQLWKKSVGIRRYLPPLDQLKKLKRSFRKDSLFLLYKDKDKAYSGAIFLKNKKNAYYWQAFTNKKARKKLIQYQIVWQGIIWAKNNNCSYFDFEGIFDSRFPNHSWLGFTHFKKSFGGKEVCYPGAFAKIKLNLW